MRARMLTPNGSWLWFALLAMFNLPGQLRAQDAERPNRRGGLWGDFGFGASWAHLACEDCDTFADGHPFRGGGGFAMRFGIGGTIHPNLLLGFRLASWESRERSSSSSLIASAIAIRYFPSTPGRFWVEPAFGFANAALSETRPIPDCTPEPLRSCTEWYDVSYRRGTSLGATLGFDLPWWKIAFNPYAGYTITFGVSESGERPDLAKLGRASGFFEFGIGVTMY